MMHFLLFFIFLGVASGQEMDLRFIGHFPEQCGEDASFCHTYCLSINPSTVKARCNRDLVSCVCMDQLGQSIAVRFVKERAPQPLGITPTTTTTTTSPPPPLPITFDYAPDGPVPILLECDGRPGATDLCHEFCTMQISARLGVCDEADQTCRCEGVSPAVIQPAPIPAVFIPRQTALPTLPTPTTTFPPPVGMQQSFWNPITYGHPNYNPVPVAGPWGGYYLPTQNQQHQPQLQWDPYHTVVNEQWINTPQQQQQQTTPTMSMTNPHQQQTSMSESTMTNPVEPEGPADKSLPPLERKRRSAAPSLPSYASVFSYGPSSESCSVTNCAAACASSFEPIRRCVPKCIDNSCICLCKPKPMINEDKYPEDLVDAKVEEIVETVLSQPVRVISPEQKGNYGAYSASKYGGQIFGAGPIIPSPHPSTILGGGMDGLTYGPNKAPMTQEQFLALFAPPPTLY